MGFSNDIITLPYTLGDAANALGYQTNDLQTLYENGSVALWAKYKPMEFSSGGAYGYALNNTQRASVNWGIGNIPYWNSRMLGHMLNFWFGIDTTQTNQPEIGLKNAYWTYLRPTTAFRLSDLIQNPDNPNSPGYFKRALPPLGNLLSTNVAVSPGGNLTFLFAKNEDGVSEGLTVRYEDLQMGGYSVYNMYFGFALWNKDGNDPKFLTLTQLTTLGSFQAMGASVHTHTEDPNIEGTYMVFPFISADPILGDEISSEIYEMTDETNIRSNFIALIDPLEITISITYADVRVLTLTSYRDTDHTNIIRNLWSVHNYMTDYPVTIGKMRLEYIKTDGYTVDYTQEIITPVNVASGNTESGQTDHNFGTDGSTHIGYVRMTIITIEGVVFFRSSSSVLVAEVTDGPTPFS